MADLRWLGIDWTRPDREDERGPYRQSQRGALYARQFAVLERQDAVYPCFCSRWNWNCRAARSSPRASRPLRRHLPGAVRRRAGAPREAGLAATLPLSRAARERVTFVDFVHGPQGFLSDDIGDFVCGAPTAPRLFFFSNAVDDACMGVTAGVAPARTTSSKHAAAAADSRGPGARAPAYGSSSIRGDLVAGSTSFPFQHKALSCFVCHRVGGTHE